MAAAHVVFVAAEIKKIMLLLIRATYSEHLYYIYDRNYSSYNLLNVYKKYYKMFISYRKIIKCKKHNMLLLKIVIFYLII